MSSEPGPSFRTFCIFTSLHAAILPTLLRLSLGQRLACRDELVVVIGGQEVEILCLFRGQLDRNIRGHTGADQAFALRGKVLVVRQAQRRAVRERIGALGISLADGLLSHHDGLTVFLQRSGKELSSRD